MQFPRRRFLKQLAGSVPALTLAPLLAADANSRFQFGVQQYTFNRWLKSGELTHLDYPKLVREKLGLNHIEYWNRPFDGKHTDKEFVGELHRRTVGEGMTNVLILVDAKNQLDADSAEKRAKALDEHKGWIDCAAQLQCEAIRINCRSGGGAQVNLQNAVDGMGALCDYAKPSGVKVVIEPHGGNSDDPDWLLQVMKEVDRPNAGLLPDFNNFGKFDRYEGVAKTLPHAVAVCAKALHFDEAGNETNTDYFRMLKIIQASDYSGVITIEFEGHDIDPVEGVLKTKALLEKALEAATA